MATATMTSKGQLTLPKLVREQLGLREGTRLKVEVEDGKAVLTPITKSLADFMSVLPQARRTRTIEEMDTAVRARMKRVP